jgi:hypothetical protein
MSTIPVFTICAIALVIIGIGLYLSYWTREPDPREMVYTDTNQPMIRRGGERVADEGKRRYRRSLYVPPPRPRNNFLALIDIRNLSIKRANKGTPWLGIGLILLACILASFWFTRALLPGAVAINREWPDAATSAPIPSAGTATVTNSSSTFQGTINAASALVRINQLDPLQYNSTQEYSTWAYSTCSAASMTEVINAYNAYYHSGPQYHVTDILRVEMAVHEITPDLGLLEPVGIDRTVAKFHFKATWLKNGSLNDVIKIANQGRPVIVGFPPARWAGGHILIVKGGDAQNVYLADSSRLNMQVMSRAQFTKYWAGFAVVIEPIR